MTTEEFRDTGHWLIDWIAAYRAGIAAMPVMAQTAPGEVKLQLPALPPYESEGFDAILRDLETIILPGLSHWQHPGFFGYFPSNGELASVLGDYVSTGLGVLGVSWQSSPALAEKYRAWLHVDAAMAGSATILPEYRCMWNGIERADSPVVNAHKWLGGAFDCSLYYVRDPKHLIAVMSTNLSYLQSRSDGTVKNFRDWGLPLGRGFRALKLWFLIREQGIAGLQSRLRRDLENAQWLAEQIGSTPSRRVVAPVHLQTVCLRHEPPGFEGEDLDAHTLRWVDRVNQSGHAYLTPAILEGRWMVRVSIGAIPTERAHIESLWSLMRQEAANGSRKE